MVSKEDNSGISRTKVNKMSFLVIPSRPLFLFDRTNTILYVSLNKQPTPIKFQSYYKPETAKYKYHRIDRGLEYV